MNLVNVEERHERAPETFEIHDRAKREGLVMGDLVKLIWEEPGRGGERMWVRVTEVGSGGYVGVLDNKPTVFVKELALGDTVEFGPEHVAHIHETDEPVSRFALVPEHKIGNLRGLVSLLIEQAERDGNEAEHQLGIVLVNLARDECLTEEQILEGLTAGKTYVRVESAMARAWNEEAERSDDPRMAKRAETWEGYIPEVENLEEIFRFFNRVEYGDGERLEEIGYDLPSLSVGDVVEWNGVRRRVEPVGWVEIRDEPDTDDEAPERRQSDDPDYREEEQQEAERSPLRK